MFLFVDTKTNLSFIYSTEGRKDDVLQFLSYILDHHPGGSTPESRPGS